MYFQTAIYSHEVILTSDSPVLSGFVVFGESAGGRRRPSAALDAL